MPTPTKGPRLGGGPAHERLILANLATQLFEHRSITTTEAKAKRLRPLAERLVTFAKRGDLASRRRVLTVVRDKSVVHELFTEIAPAMAERQGGYTRITKIGPRKGDNAPMAVISLVLEPLAKKETVAEAEAATKRAVKESEVAAPAVEETSKDDAAEAADATAEETTSDEAASDETASDKTASDESASDESAAAADGADADQPEGSHAPLEDGSQPEGFPIKGNADSMKFHTPASQWYEQTVPEIWFATEEAAQAAGYTKAG